jgi:ketosteroid isomerase-like protein
MKTFLSLTCALIISATTSAQKSETVAPLTSLADTERAFAKTSEEKGTREAFLAFIAEDGTLFRPTAVKGKQWLLEHPLAPSTKRPLLAWQPSFAYVARAGDLGYTFGPWEFKQDIKDQKPIAYGHFVTVWQKQSDGSWRFVVDLGIEHSQLTAASKDWQGNVNYEETSWTREKIDLESARTALLAIDRKFSNSSEANGATKAFQAYSSSHVRLFRNDHYPLLGDAIKQFLSTISSSRLMWQPLAADISRSGDLGYTHGTYVRNSNEDGKAIERGNYLRIWERDKGDWKVVVDVANPLPPEVKN